jgi:IS5 family transposase
MKGAETIAWVRRAFLVRGSTVKEICRELHISRNTVRKILRSEAACFEYEREGQLTENIRKEGRGAIAPREVERSGRPAPPHRSLAAQASVFSRDVAAVAALSQLAGLIDWAEIDRHPVGISASRKGEPGWPPLALLRALLLATWHELSDVKLAEALDNRARFRRALVRGGLDRVLFDAVTRQLEANGVMVRTGTLVDATLIPSTGIRGDGDAGWAGHRCRKPTHGYKAQAATDEAAVLIRGVEVTTANVHDADQVQAVLPPEPDTVYGEHRRSAAGHNAFAGRSRACHPRLWRHALCGSDRHLGPRAGSPGTARHAQCRRAPRPVPDRDGVRHLQALVRTAADALDRPRQGRPAGPARCHRRQPRAEPQCSSARLRETGGLCPQRGRRSRTERYHPDRSQTRAPILTIRANFNPTTTPAHRPHDPGARMFRLRAVRLSRSRPGRSPSVPASAP